MSELQKAPFNENESTNQNNTHRFIPMEALSSGKCESVLMIPTSDNRMMKVKQKNKKVEIQHTDAPTSGVVDGDMAERDER